MATTTEVRNLTLRLDQSHAELDRWRQAAEVTTSSLSATTNALQSMTAERDRVTASLLTTQSQVVTARSTIARLERSVNSLQRDRNRLAQLEQSCTSLTRDLAFSQEAHQRLEAERDQVVGSASTTPASASLSSKRPRSPTASSPSSRADLRGRPRQRHPSRPEQASSRRPRGGSRSRARETSLCSSPVDSQGSDSDDSLMAALAQLRSSGRRHRGSSGVEASSSSEVIHLESSSESGNDNENGTGDFGGGGDSSHRDVSSGGSGSGPLSQDYQGSFDDVDRSRHSGATSMSGAHRNVLLSAAAFQQLAPTRIPRTHWVPGYREPTQLANVHVAPWSSDLIRHTSVLELDLDTLFRELSKPRHWVFPVDAPASTSNDWHSELITEANVRALYADVPWRVLSTPIPPITFTASGEFEVISHKYSTFQDRHLQALWEATHSFPVPESLRKRNPYLARFWTARKQRRSRLGAAWKRFLKWVLRCLISGQCDLDLLLDPYFLHYPRSGEKARWFPGIGSAAAPADLISAFRDVDAAEPWRNQFRANIQAHPGSHLIRLEGKFIPL